MVVQKPNHSKSELWNVPFSNGFRIWMFGIQAPTVFALFKHCSYSVGIRLPDIFKLERSSWQKFRVQAMICKKFIFWKAIMEPIKIKNCNFYCLNAEWPFVRYSDGYCIWAFSIKIHVVLAEYFCVWKIIKGKLPLLIIKLF